MLDISRAAITIRLCMAAFMMAYLMQTIAALYVEHFESNSASSEFMYLFRVYLVTPQQFIYFLQYHNATISSSGGALNLPLNTKVQKFILEQKLKATQSVQNKKLSATRGAKSLMSSSKSVDVASMMNQSRSIFQNSSQLRGGSWVVLRELARAGQAVLFTPVSLFVWVPLHFMRHNYSEKLVVILLGVLVFEFATIFPVVIFEGTPNLGEVVIFLHVAFVFSVCIVGIYRNRQNTELLVIDGPRKQLP